MLPEHPQRQFLTGYSQGLGGFRLWGGPLAPVRLPSRAARKEPGRLREGQPAAHPPPLCPPIRPSIRPSPGPSAGRTPASAHPGAGGGRGPGLGPRPAPVLVPRPPLLPPPLPHPPKCSASCRHRIPWNGGRGREIRTGPPAAPSPRARGPRRGGRGAGASPLPSMASTKSPWYSGLRSFSSRLKPRALTISSTSDTSSFSSYRWRSIGRCGGTPKPEREPRGRYWGVLGGVSPLPKGPGSNRCRSRAPPAPHRCHPPEQLGADAQDAGNGDQERGRTPRVCLPAPYTDRAFPSGIFGGRGRDIWGLSLAPLPPPPRGGESSPLSREGAWLCNRRGGLGARAGGALLGPGWSPAAPGSALTAARRPRRRSREAGTGAGGGGIAEPGAAPDLPGKLGSRNERTETPAAPADRPPVQGEEVGRGGSGLEWERGSPPATKLPPSRDPKTHQQLPHRPISARAHSLPKETPPSLPASSASSSRRRPAPDPAAPRIPGAPQARAAPLLRLFPATTSPLKCLRR